ncbi:MAG: hypothetical protein LBH34_00260 [Prevotellaceae bacterium]|nr:hypothetical protein [Prevotellaceae bacterium]
MEAVLGALGSGHPGVALPRSVAGVGLGNGGYGSSLQPCGDAEEAPCHLSSPLAEGYCLPFLAAIPVSSGNGQRSGPRIRPGFTTAWVWRSTRQWKYL